MNSVATIHTDSLPGAPTPSRCQLVVVDGPDQGRAVSLDQDEITVGSGADCTLVLLDERVSRQHLSIQRDDAHFLVRDLGSLNGTLLQGSLISEARVAAGAVLKVGHTLLRIQPERKPLDLPPSQSRRLGDMVAESLSMREVFAVLELAAQSDVTVLLEGETGCGKEVAARAIHDASTRRGKPFVAVDCGALPESLLESELFGHVRGAFTGAMTQRAGAFARAHGGTIFLDELGQVTPAVQARLLRVVEERAVKPVGSDVERPVDVRIVAASRHDLEKHMAEGVFRADLFYRLSVVKVTLPPLRSRREDIIPLVTELLRRRGIDAGSVEGPSLDLLMGHGWPGNVRELRNVMDRAVALSPGAQCFMDLRVDVSGTTLDEPLAVRSDLPFADAKAAVVAAFEVRYLRDVLARCEGNISAASRLCGLDRKHLRELLRKHGLADPQD